MIELPLFNLDSQSFNEKVPGGQPRPKASRLMGALLFALLPSWIQCHFQTEPQSHRALSKTAWLDGVRGVAAFIVSIYHYLQPYRGFYNNPYNPSKGGIEWSSVIQLPIIRLMYSGVTMVAIFFVISGYVLSFRKVETIRKRDSEKLSDMLFSSIVRRGFRLFPPVMVFFALLGIEDHFLWNTSTISAYVGQVTERIMLLFTSTLLIGQQSVGLIQFWTIPIEFTNSMILFVVIAGISRMNTTMRMASVGGLAFFVLQNGYWGLYLFLFGWIIAEVETILQQSNRPSSFLQSIFWGGMLFVGLLIGSYPSQNIEHDMLLSGLPSITPKVYTEKNYHAVWYFWVSIAAPLIVWPIFHLPALQNLFTTRTALYLGNISYALYTVHYQVMPAVENRLHAVGDTVFGVERNDHFTRHGAMILETVIYEFIVLWQADLFWRFVDIPSIKLAKWVEKCVRAY